VRLALPNLRGGVAPAAAAFGILLVALGFAAITTQQPIVALAVPGVMLTAIACARWPALGVLIIVTLAGAAGSLQAFFGIPAGPIIDLILAGLWVSVLYAYVVKTRVRPWWVWPGIGLTLLYLVVSFFQMWTALGVSLGFLSFRASQWYMMVIPLLAFAGWKLGTYVRISYALVFAGLAVAGYAVLRMIIGIAGEEWIAAHTFGAGAFNTVTPGELSTIGSFHNRHDLAFWQAVSIPFCLAIALAPGKQFWRLAAAAAIPLGAAATFGTDVRMALPAIGVGVVVVIGLNLVASRGRGTPLAHALIAALLTVVAGAALFSVVLGEEDQERYGAILSPSGDTSFEAHVDRWEKTLQELDDQPMGFGLGTAGRLARGGIPYVTFGSYSIDSVYLKIAYEQGFPVLALFMAAMIALLVGLARRAVRSRAGPVRGLAIAGTASLASALVMFITGVYTEALGSMFLWLAVGAAIGALAAAKDDEMPPSDDDPESAPSEPAPPELPEASPPREPVLGRV
jgi:hypothetical protein